MNEYHTWKNRLLNESKKVSKRDSNVPHHGGFQGSTSNKTPQSQMLRKYGVKKNELKCLVFHTILRVSEPHSWYFDSSCSCHMCRPSNFLSQHMLFHTCSPSPCTPLQYTISIPYCLVIHHSIMIHLLPSLLQTLKPLLEGVFGCIV